MDPFQMSVPRVDEGISCNVLGSRGYLSAILALMVPDLLRLTRQCSWWKTDRRAFCSVKERSSPGIYGSTPLSTVTLIQPLPSVMGSEMRARFMLPLYVL